jgi:hypothetical protein
MVEAFEKLDGVLAVGDSLPPLEEADCDLRRIRT